MSGTAKAIYSVLAYPTSADIDHVISTFVGSGGQCMWILHNKDTKMDGTKKMIIFILLWDGLSALRIGKSSVRSWMKQGTA